MPGLPLLSSILLDFCPSPAERHQWEFAKPSDWPPVHLPQVPQGFHHLTNPSIIPTVHIFCYVDCFWLLQDCFSDINLSWMVQLAYCFLTAALSMPIAPEEMEAVNSQGSIMLLFHQSKDKHSVPSTKVFSTSYCHVLVKVTFNSLCFHSMSLTQIT